MRLGQLPTSRRRPGVEFALKKILLPQLCVQRRVEGAGSCRRTGLGLELAARASPLAPSAKQERHDETSEGWERNPQLIMAP